jgi:serine phosphatase RsbU (regulator of sigma subunit)
VLSAVLEPRYNTGGDGFDYAFDGPVARLMIFDGVGRGLRAGLAFTVAMMAIRAARRAGRPSGGAGPSGIRRPAGGYTARHVLDHW